MENQEGVSIKLPSIETITGRRQYIPGLFGIAILFFFFNFCELSCHGQTFAKVSGINLVTGTQLENPERSHSLGFGAASEEDSHNKMPGSIWALFALLAAVAGLTIFLIGHKKEELTGIIAGTAGVISLFILKVTLSDSIKEQGQGMVSISFLFPYWASLFALAVAGTICFIRSKKPSLQLEHSNLETQVLFTPERTPAFIAETVPSPHTQNYTNVLPHQPPIRSVDSPPPPVLTPPTPDLMVPPVNPPALSYSTPPLEQYHYTPNQKKENAPPDFKTQTNKSQNYTQGPADQNWLIWLIIGAVSLMIVATVVVELI